MLFMLLRDTHRGNRQKSSFLCGEGEKFTARKFLGGEGHFEMYWVSKILFFEKFRKIIKFFCFKKIIFLLNFIFKFFKRKIFLINLRDLFKKAFFVYKK